MKWTGAAQTESLRFQRSKGQSEMPWPLLSLNLRFYR
jgi:hypothetical protein